MSEPVIRFMRLKDVDQVAGIEEATFARPWSRESFRQELTRNAVARYLVADEDGQILGYAGAWVILDESHITNIAVREDARGRGLGKRLTADLLQIRAAEVPMPVSVRYAWTDWSDQANLCGENGLPLEPFWL